MNTLFIGDRFWGSQPLEPQNGEPVTAPGFVSRELILQSPARFSRFHISSSSRNTPQYLVKNCSREIIGHQPQLLILCLGMEFLQSRHPRKKEDQHDKLAESFLLGYKQLLDEVTNNCKARIVVTTLPYALFEYNQETAHYLKQINEWILTRDKVYNYTVADFSGACSQFVSNLKSQEKEIPGRSLLDAHDRLTPLGIQLLGHTLLPAIQTVLDH